MKIYLTHDMKHASFFTGLGVVDLAAELLGWENIFQVEKDKWLQKRLNNVFKNTTKYEDIKTFDGTKYRGAIDIISGGDPCQPSSVAGNRKGKADDRYLWPEMFRCIKEIRPSWVFNENVTGTISNGILDQKISDLESEGYTCWPPIVIPASAVGAPHQRYRCFLVAYSNGERNEIPIAGRNTTKQMPSSNNQNAPNTTGQRCEEFNMPEKPIRKEIELAGSTSGTIANPYSQSRGEQSELSSSYAAQSRKEFDRNSERLMSNSDQFNGNISGLHSGEISQFGTSPILKDYEQRFRDSFGGFDWKTNWHDVASEFCRMDDGSAKKLDKGHRIKALGNGIVLPQILEILCCIDFLESYRNCSSSLNVC